MLVSFKFFPYLSTLTIKWKCVRYLSFPASHVPIINLFFLKAHIFTVKFILIFPHMIVPYPLCCMYMHITPLCIWMCVCVHVCTLPNLTSLTVGCCKDLFSAQSGWLWIKCIFRHLFTLFFSAVPLSTQLELRSGHTNRQTDRQTRTHTHIYTQCLRERHIAFRTNHCRTTLCGMILTFCLGEIAFNWREGRYGRQLCNQGKMSTFQPKLKT